MLEREFQANTIKEIRGMFPGCVILKNDANYLQGIPDYSIFYRDRWAWLEFKKSEKEDFRPNQELYVSMGNDMSFARVIYPNNKQEVLSELQQAFEAGRNSRNVRRQ